MGDIHSPRHYFLELLIPEYERFGRSLMDGIVGNRRDLIALGRAAEACLHLADHIARDPVLGPSIPGFPRSREYVKDLAARFRYFAIARDIANAFKHRKISDADRRIEGLDSLKERWALIRFTDEGGVYFATRKVVLVKLIGGVEIFAEDVIERCVAAWTNELLRLKVIPSAPRIRLVPKRLLERTEVPPTPAIEMHMAEGEYFESSPILLDYDRERDMFMPLKSKIGEVFVDITSVIRPSRFSHATATKTQLTTIRVFDRGDGTQL